MPNNTAQSSPESARVIEDQAFIEALSQQPPDPTNLLNTIIRESVFLLASDILLEPRQNFVLVRVRIDGVLYEIGQIHHETHQQLSSRIKVLSNLDITKRDKVQEGQFSFVDSSGEVSMRVEIVETVYGELLVMRIHEKGTIVMKLSELGFSEQAYETYQKIIKQRSGLVITCGPTGCGKTTTLYSTINEINTNHNFNVMTVEDPVEYKFEGLNQMQTDERKGFTFAAGIRTILRLSPDVILVGEIRDKETAEIAVESGLTGQFVFSTLHAEDSIGALFRLLDLGIEPYLLNSSLMGVVAQRLVRKNCSNCLGSFEPNEEEKDVFMNILGHIPEKLTKSTGCPDCKNLSYRGRIGIFEVLHIDSHIRDLIRKQVNETDLRNSLVNEGFVTLLKDGLQKCEQGVTTVSEVLRNSLRVD